MIGAALTTITVQLTVGNLAPFIASMIAYIVIGEKTTWFEIIAMFLSFGAITLIAISQGNRDIEEIGEDEEAKSYIFFGNDVRMAGIVGCITLVIMSITSGALSVMTRVL